MHQNYKKSTFVTNLAKFWFAGNQNLFAGNQLLFAGNQSLFAGNQKKCIFLNILILGEYY